MSYPPPPDRDGEGQDGEGREPTADPPPGSDAPLGYLPGGYPPGGYASGPGWAAPPGGPPGPNSKAVAALAVGVVALPLALCCSVVGLLGTVSIVLGRVARREIEASGGRQSGAGMAQAGFALGIVDCVLAVVTLVISVLLVSSGTVDLNTYVG